MGRLFDTYVFPLCLPLILAWLLAARLLSLLAPLLIVPSILLNRRLRHAIPFIPHIWRQQGWLLGSLMRMGFECNYTINVARRFLTLPLRRRGPNFYVVGFPKCGTTSLANHLKLHPAISCIDGLNLHDALSKESHFFCGALGRHTTASAAAYRSYFPTVLQRWWVERVRGAGKWLVFDACPVTACLDFAAERMAAVSPDAKLVFMLRDPVSAAFSAEIMLRNLGVPLEWSLMEDVRPADPRFAATQEDLAYWNQVAALAPGEPLPADLMDRFYFSCHALLRSGHYADRIAPFLRHFKRENMLFVEFMEFTSNTQAVVARVLEFVGSDPSLQPHRELPPGMKGEHRGRRIHPSCQRKLREHFAEPNQRLYALLGRDFGWDAAEGAVEPRSKAGALAGHSKPGGLAGTGRSEGLEIAAVAGGEPAVAAMV